MRFLSFPAAVVCAWALPAAAQDWPAAPRAPCWRWPGGPRSGRFADFLRERGYKPAGGRVPDGSDWAGWRNRTDRVFGTLFPPAAQGVPAAGAPQAP
jgi:hypothetical protein